MLPDAARCCDAARHDAPIDPRMEAVFAAEDVRVALLARGRAAVAPANVLRAAPGRIEVRAEGPGLLVVAEGYDPGWSARSTDVPRASCASNHAQIGLVLGRGPAPRGAPLPGPGSRGAARGATLLALWPAACGCAAAAGAACLTLARSGVLASRLRRAVPST